MLKEVKKPNLSDLVVEQIRDLISGPGISPGYCLGTEREICKVLKVSRPILRESLSCLKAQGFIRVSREGVFVNSLAPASMVESLERIVEEDHEKIFELNEVRKILESGMAVMAIPIAQREDIEKVRQALNDMEKSYFNKQIGHNEDVQFHLRLAECSHNNIYIQILHTVLSLFQKGIYLYRSTLMGKRGNAEKMMNQHREIFDAFVAKEPDRLRDAIVNHLVWSSNSIKELGIDRKELYLPLRKRTKPPSSVSRGV